MSAPGRCERFLRACAAALGLSCASPADPASAAPPDYTALAETGLYSSSRELGVSARARAFAPAFALWSDGATKSRWIELPEGERIDTRDMDHWLFPVGTRAWKEFALDGVRLETRLIERWGPGASDYFMGAFVWNAEQTQAWLAPDGAEDVLGTEHDVPARDRCPACHDGDVGRILGFSAFQLRAAALVPELAEAGFASLDISSAEGWLDELPPPPPAPASDATATAALGYLHANCGHCHNPRGTAWPDTQMLLRLELDDSLDERSGPYQSVVSQRLQYVRDQRGEITLRVDPGHPESSGLVARMAVRGPKVQMPPLATEQVDAAGVELMRDWIAAMPATPPR
jgi:hypothetical protein